MKILLFIVSLTIVSFSFSQKLTPLENLKIEEGIFYKKKKKFTGSTYQIGKDTLLNRPITFYFRIDSTVYTFTKGECTSIQYFKNSFLKEHFHISKKDSATFVTRETYQYSRRHKQNKKISLQEYVNGKKDGQQIIWAWYQKEDKSFNYYIKETHHFHENTLCDTSFYYRKDNSFWKEKIYGTQPTLITNEYYPSSNQKEKQKIYANNTYSVTEEFIWSLEGKIVYHQKNREEDVIIKNGKYTTLINKAILESAHYSNDTLHGVYEKFYAEGNLWERKTYAHGKLNGIHEKWYMNDTLALQVTYINDLKDGEEKSWYANGVLWTTYIYSHGKEHGIFNRWYRNGILGKTGQYDYGIPYGTFNHYYDDKTDWKIFEYSETTEGLWCHYRSWWKGGQRSEESTTLNGELHNLYQKWWYTTGNLRLQVQYLHGRKNGKYKNWLQDGTLYNDLVFIKNKRYKATKFKDTVNIDIIKNISIETGLFLTYKCRNVVNIEFQDSIKQLEKYPNEYLSKIKFSSEDAIIKKNKNGKLILYVTKRRNIHLLGHLDNIKILDVHLGVEYVTPPYIEMRINKKEGEFVTQKGINAFTDKVLYLTAKAVKSFTYHFPDDDNYQINKVRAYLMRDGKIIKREIYESSVIDVSKLMKASIVGDSLLIYMRDMERETYTKDWTYARLWKNRIEIPILHIDK